jgi:uncharacterized protein (DUF849 family)
MSPYLPITPQEIANNAIEAASAGAASVHIHARNPLNGMPSSEHIYFEEIIERIREQNSEVIICLTTGGGAGMTVDERASVIPKFKPELASMNAGSINWGIYEIAEKINHFKYDWEEAMFSKSMGYIFQNTFSDMERIFNILHENKT